jgi:hypothetical protein
MMSDFVEQCRREWRRLGVPDALAEEMAADLASDLGEAEAEGVSAEDLLGGVASDPRAFAASWAGERGIIPERSSRGHARRKPPALVAFTALAAIALIVAALLLVTGEPKVVLKATRTGPPHASALPGITSLPPGHQVQASAAAPIEWILLFLAVAALGFAVWLWSRWSRLQPPVASAK